MILFNQEGSCHTEFVIPIWYIAETNKLYFLTFIVAVAVIIRMWVTAIALRLCKQGLVLLYFEKDISLQKRQFAVLVS